MSDRETTGEAPNLLGAEVLDLTTVSEREIPQAEYSPEIAAPEQAPVQMEADPAAVSEARAAALQAAREVPRAKDELLSHVEEALSARLKNLYVQIPDGVKPAFRKRGEEIAVKIRAMIASGRLSEGTVLDLVEGWLKLVPKVTREFLTQEAKIITDSVLKVRE
ncbi:hypothetical protein KBC55_02225 [Patescibacteria group bacterium]|nr:hypothetical protein [Patescibacteria group bacterium]